MSKVDTTLRIGLSEERYFGIENDDYNLLTSCMKSHATDFIEWCVKRGRIKVYHTEAEIEKLYNEFNNGE